MRAKVSKGRWRAGEDCKPAAVILLALAQLLPAAAAPASQPVAH